eukprot:TRINITY_DN818_c0_g1_i19.p1 TRINITY_DN818_c0_g1~~TRINITY_DN818_c0_g1_i19.p1  ORF type:complete len:233 (-),score=89.33 TRINITY_DN818_c0_g1_i19:133-831(-)
MKFIEQLYKNLSPSVEIKSEEELRKRAEVKAAAVILVGGSKEDLEEFEKVPKKYEGVWFFRTSTELAQKVFPEIKKTPSIVLIKEINEDRSVYSGEMKEKAIENFINTYNKPTVSSLSQEVINQLFKDTGKKGVILLREENQEGKRVEEVLKILASKYRSEDLLFVVTDIESELGKRVAKMMGLSKESLPHMEIVERKKKLERNKFEGEFTQEAIDKFITTWRSAHPYKTDL